MPTTPEQVLKIRKEKEEKKLASLQPKIDEYVEIIDKGLLDGNTSFQVPINIYRYIKNIYQNVGWGVESGLTYNTGYNELNNNLMTAYFFIRTT